MYVVKTDKLGVGSESYHNQDDIEHPCMQYRRPSFCQGGHGEDQVDVQNLTYSAMHQRHSPYHSCYSRIFADSKQYVQA